MSDHTIQYPGVFHVGNLDRDRNPPSYSFEGDGLSVSRCPNDWASIARLGRHAYGLANPDSLFYDASLDGPREHVHNWCCANDFVREVDGYRVYYEDRERGEDERYMEFYDRDEAETHHASNEYPNSRLELVTSLTLETRGRDYWRDAFTSDPEDASPVQIRGLLPVWYAEYTDDHDYDGVWWHEWHDPRNYSAPRGVIFQSKLDEWDIVWEGELDDTNRPGADELPFIETAETARS